MADGGSGREVLNRRVFPILCSILMALPAGVCIPADAADEPVTRPPGGIRRFFEEHGARLAGSFAIFAASRGYDRTWGPSTDPLLFDDPPSPDRLAHEQWSERRGARGFVENNGAQTLHYGVPLALVALDWRDRSLMARDLLGFVEMSWTNGGITKLLKNVVGRERPDLEFAAEEGLDPDQIAELEDKKDSRRSFPSGHASVSFSCASYMERVLARRLGRRGPARSLSFAALYGLAGYISYSRVAVSKHYLSDIVAGAAIGVGVSRTLYRWNHPEEFPSRDRHAGRRSRVRAAPAAVPVPGGGALMVAISIEQGGQLGE